MGEFGGLLIAAYINLPPIFDSSIELHRLTVACAIVFYGYVTFYVVVYQPQSTSVYHIPIIVLTEIITSYHSVFVSF